MLTNFLIMSFDVIFKLHGVLEQTKYFKSLLKSKPDSCCSYSYMSLTCQNGNICTMFLILVTNIIVRQLSQTARTPKLTFYLAAANPKKKNGLCFEIQRLFSVVLQFQIVQRHLGKYFKLKQGRVVKKFLPCQPVGARLGEGCIAISHSFLQWKINGNPVTDVLIQLGIIISNQVAIHLTFQWALRCCYGNTLHWCASWLVVSLSATSNLSYILILQTLQLIAKM